jgi:5-methyltetrahydropteroyltriglutamate--homocysteine methyltransferase
MCHSSVIGFPRVGELRELKFATEKYFKNELSLEELQAVTKELRKKNWELLKVTGIDFIPSNDFSLYDNVLDTSVLFNAIPERYRKLGLTEIDTYFALARGYQGERGNVKALSMKKWFNTNYHYLVPELSATTNIQYVGKKLAEEFREAQRLGIKTKPVIIGPFTYLKLASYRDEKQASDFVSAFIAAYKALFEELEHLGVEWFQMDEPSLVLDLTSEDIELFKDLYQPILANKQSVKVLLQTYFGDIRDGYETVTALPFDGFGLDFIEGRKTLELVQTHDFPKTALLFAGVVNGKNIWRNNYQKSLDILHSLPNIFDVVISSSCSLLHVPYTLRNETKLVENIRKHFAFAEEKLNELLELKLAYGSKDLTVIDENQKLFDGTRTTENIRVQKLVAELTEKDFIRFPSFEQREEIQRKALKLPILPTTTIGSFPQTQDVRQNRAQFRKGAKTREQYDDFIFKKIAECVEWQENAGFDVLVHGEFERNDMVEFFGENLEGYIFTEKAWVQSYGTRCVKPPIIWGDIEHIKPITVEYSKFAQSLTEKIMKGMLTGPVTILNWSFPREDISLRESTLQIALAIQEEVLDLEANGIKIIQIDEAALREKLPLRKSDWYSEYLDWAIPAFRLVHGKVQPETQIHTHMCYSEFEDIIQAIDNLDADVISFEASRSNLHILDVLKENHFQTQVGPGIYDIHSPRIPEVSELVSVIDNILEKLPIEKVWINPDCGLKTRGDVETKASLKNLITATRLVRDNILVKE